MGNDLSATRRPGRRSEAALSMNDEIATGMSAPAAEDKMDEPWTASSLRSASGARLRLYRRLARTRPERGLVLVHHGLAEHAGRYERFSAWLAERGFTVYAHDHRGHGRTEAPDAPLRRFAKSGGAAAVLADCEEVRRHALAERGPLPVVVFGHSMGAMTALCEAGRHGRDLAGLAVWNVDVEPSPAYRVARLTLAVEKALKGSDVASRLMQRATFEAFARAIEDRRGAFDWLSHERAEVERYEADPLCGFSPTISMMADVVSLAASAGTRGNLARLPADLPIHLLGGTQDPATANGRAVTRLARRLRDLGAKKVTSILIEGARHETLNERPPLRRTALSSLERWLDDVVPPSGQCGHGAGRTPVQRQE